MQPKRKETDSSSQLKSSEVNHEAQRSDTSGFNRFGSSDKINAENAYTRRKRKFIPGLSAQLAPGYGVYTDSITGTVVINISFALLVLLVAIEFILFIVVTNVLCL